jgi:hypothetical protein
LLNFQVSSVSHYQAVGNLAVASGPSGFLVKGLYGTRQIIVDDEPDIGFVYSHSKGIGRNNDGGFIPDEIFLNTITLRAAESPVISLTGYAIFVEIAGKELSENKGSNVK